ncbi:uncharacterized protein EV420DRAFT_1487493 [Desarmillaria tabescens]|uniref:Uncharacterized protein n=1 Tax=Armillaria tabescens TaxID=1929756 RepID=A0AA39MJU2_ARMTA|nr:uncharacterized protein EV420DRAFT_1487493 [Desarmillaria tabescens]KAK0436503.1 hypothetical protein EV420DRAFT_1487493 [Desarmillaria tabescens]
MAGQCALDADGNLKSPSKINFYHDVDDDVPMAGPEAASKPQASEPLGRGQRTGKAGRMKDALEAEKLDEYGVSIKPVVLMLVKHRLHLAHTAVNELLDSAVKLSKNLDGTVYGPAVARHCTVAIRPYTVDVLSDNLGHQGFGTRLSIFPKSLIRFPANEITLLE